MRPARRSAPAALRLPARLAPSLGLLLLRLLWCPHAARGDCGFPPDMPNATVLLENRTIFPVGTIVGYYCNPGFVKIIGKVNVVHCLPNGQWTKPEVFCQRSCGPTPRVPYAHKKDVYIPVSSYPAGFIVEYECNPGFARNHSVSGNVTCLQDYTWSKSEVFCYKKSCPDPGKIENGHIIIPTDILFTSEIYFSCDPGYKLVGVNSTYCDYEGDNMIWENPFPECQEIPTTTQKPSTTDVPSTKAPSAPQKPTIINVKATKSPSTLQKPTTINVPATKAPSAPQKPTTVTIPATKSTSAPQKLTTVTFPATKSPSAPQKHTTVTIPATKSPSAPQKHTTVTIPATEAPSTSQKPTTVNVPSTEGTPTLQNLTTRSSSTTKVLLSPQKDTLPVLAMDAPTTSQKPFAASDSATIVKTSVSKALSTEIQLTVQTLLMTNASATQATSKPQSFTTAKASYAQSLPVTQKFSTVHAPMTKGHYTTQRLTSAHIAVTQNQIVFTRQSTSKGSGFLTAGVPVIASGLTVGAIIIAIVILTKIYENFGRTGIYHLHENNKAPNVMFHNLTETVDASEV
ncbi:complement decay-accelerating factor isoform X1 [Pipistrellus kuhlii]|uniref:complement decay-accelerating factor isoform X1 n=1 Tax=Pipistrellus kuhlii TaxID=59472 RepID=UPI001E2736B7|nr:complement decay-accelerating factor isoform X1 [Pipistrellus kuhlii]